MRWLALLLAGSAWAADTALPRFVPADAKVVMGVHLRKILDSPMGKNFSKGAVTPALPQFGGVDFLKDVDEVTLVTNGTDQKSPSLFVLKGRFHQLAGARYHDVPVMTVPDKPDQLLAVLDETTALGGDAAMVHAAIDHRNKPASNAALAARIADFSGRYDFWGVGDHLPPNKDAGEMDSVDGFSFGATLRDGLQMGVDFHLRRGATSEKTMSALQLLAGMLKSQSGASKIDFSAKRDSIKVAIAIPEAELRRAMEAQKASLTKTVTGPLTLSQPKPAPKPGSVQTDEKGNTFRLTLPGGF